MINESEPETVNGGRLKMRYDWQAHNRRAKRQSPSDFQTLADMIRNESDGGGSERREVALQAIGDAPEITRHNLTSLLRFAPSFFIYGLCYSPVKTVTCPYRTIHITNIPKHTKLVDILAKVQCGLIYDSILLDTTFITESTTASITFFWANTHSVS
ncbi:hypothetical protein F5884DRAFT_772146 [Xylogone sp. PMI_703]|nr:hypothetical protein F5884DRAFT_772146 [Xylogone sp. PMI_703]